MLIVAVSLHDVENTLHRLLLVELLVTLAVLAALGRSGFVDHSHRSAAARRDRGNGGRDHGRRPVASGRASRSAAPKSDGSGGAQHDARPDRGVGQAPASLRRRRLARASHPARRGTRATPSCSVVAPPTRPDDLERSMTRHHARDGADEPARRRPAPARAARRGPAARARAGRLRGGRRRGGRRSESGGVRASDRGRSSSRATIIGDRGRLRQVVDNLFANVRATRRPARPSRSSSALRAGRRSRRRRPRSRASPKTTPRGSSSASIASTRRGRARAAASASGSPSSRRSSQRTADRQRPNRPRAAARPSSSRSRSPSRDAAISALPCPHG